MKVFVKLKPNSKHESIKRTGKNKFSIKVKEQAKEGEANKALINALSEYLDVPKYSIEIVSGHKSKNKVLEVK